MVHNLSEDSTSGQFFDPKSFYEHEGLIARRYDSTNFWERRYHQKKVAIVHSVMDSIVPQDKLILDVGSGTGELSILAQDLGGHVVSLDISRSYLSRLRGPIKNRVCASSDYLPFKSNVFDIVLSADVIEHLPAYDKAITELYRVSLDIVVITTPCNGVTRRIYGKLFPKKLTYWDNKVGHLIILSLPELRQHLSKPNWALSCRSYHVIQPVVDNFFSKRMSGVVSLCEKIANAFLPSMGTISLAIAIREHNPSNPSD